MVAARHRLGQHRFDDLVEVEVDVVAGDVELHRGDLAGRHRGVDLVDQRDELFGGEAADGDDGVLLAGARVVVAQVGVDPDIAPAEGVEPAAVDLPQRLTVALDQCGQFVQRPHVAGGEVPLAGLDGERAGGDTAEAGQRHELRDRAHAVGHQFRVGHAVTEQAGRGHQAVAQSDVAEPHAELGRDVSHQP